MPLLSRADAKLVEEYDGWLRKGEFCYVTVVLLYALSIEGSLVYNRDLFVERYSPVFSLLSRSTVDTILLQLFSPKFIEVYSERLEDEDKLNFFTAALFFNELYEVNRTLQDNRVGNFVRKNKKKNVGFHLSLETEN